MALDLGIDRNSRILKSATHTSHKRQPHRRRRAVRSSNRTMYCSRTPNTSSEDRRIKISENSEHLHWCRQYGQCLLLDGGGSWCPPNRPNLAGRVINTPGRRCIVDNRDTVSCLGEQTPIRRPRARRRRQRMIKLISTRSLADERLQVDPTRDRLPHQSPPRSEIHPPSGTAHPERRRRVERDGLLRTANP